MKMFAISDHHFGHHNILKFYPNARQSTIEEDAKKMIEEHNKVVGLTDLVVFVGDFICGVRSSKDKKVELVRGLLNKLNGRKILVRGNHDHLTDEDFKLAGFDDVKKCIQIGNYMFHHYPDTESVVKYCKDQNLVLVHGHTHKEVTFGDGLERVNVCVEVLNYVPKELK